MVLQAKDLSKSILSWISSKAILESLKDGVTVGFMTSLMKLAEILY